MADWIWMRHPDGTEPARFPADAAEVWQARGWEPCAPPPEPDPTREQTTGPATTGQADDETPTRKTAGRQRRAETEESR